MKPLAILLFFTATLGAQEAPVTNFSCPAGEVDVMKYFAMGGQTRSTQFMAGQPNSIYTEVFPDQDFARQGYWFWLKSPQAHGFDVKAFDHNFVYMRSTELVWGDNTTFKRFVHDLPISARCVTPGKSGPEIKSDRHPFSLFRFLPSLQDKQLGNRCQ